MSEEIAAEDANDDDTAMEGYFCFLLPYKANK
jgi:hypothetical protein